MHKCKECGEVWEDEFEEDRCPECSRDGMGYFSKIYRSLLSPRPSETLPWVIDDWDEGGKWDVYFNLK